MLFSGTLVLYASMNWMKMISWTIFSLITDLKGEQW